MKSKFFNLKRVVLLSVLGLSILLAVGALLILYPYSRLFEKKDSATNGPTPIDSRYMSEISGIDRPEEMQRQYKRHPEEYRFALDDDLGVMFAYPDSNIAWIGMVFVHHFPSVSEMILDYEGNVIYEQITSPEVQVLMNSLLNDKTFIVGLQNRMGEIWGLNDPGVGVLELVYALQATGMGVEFLGGRPQTLFDASMFLIRVTDQDVMVYEFEDKAARRVASDHISPDGYEFTQQEGEITTVIHIEYIDQPNFWAEGHLLVQYLGTDQAILELLTAELGDSLTIHNTMSPISGWQTYSNPYFKISLGYPAHWQHLEGEMQYGEKFGGEDGYFTFTAMGDADITLDQAVSSEVQHKLEPYGPDPLVKVTQIQGQEARLILPSVSEADNLRWQAALLVLYPQPISLTVGEIDHRYPIFALYSDPVHIQDIAESLQFDIEISEESGTSDISGDDLSCLSVSEISLKVFCPENYFITQIKEQNRRGSFASYRFQMNGESHTPSLMEIQFFTAESIETFNSTCSADVPCFFGSYPTLKLFADLMVAYGLRETHQEYSLKMFVDRYFFIKNIPCHGDTCIIREYISFFDDVMIIIWIAMEDETQSVLSDQLFNQVIFIQHQS